MFERNALTELKRWSERPDRKPLILRGARQVGKTTLVEEFAKSYGTFLKLNLDKQEDAELFEKGMNTDSLVTAIYMLNNKPRKNDSALLFIDEVQNSSKAVAQLRYFYEEAPNLHVIAAGSLLESLVGSNQISFPVGRVEYMAIRPCSFNEFLGAVSETELKGAQGNAEIPTALHQKVNALFNTYALIGGMPEVVSHYSKNKDLVSLRRIYETLITGYRDDIEKYARNESSKNILRYILAAGWAYAAQRITFEKFGNSNYRSKDMGEAFRTLEKAMLLELCYPTTSCLVPLIGEIKRAPKLLWLDSGLVNHAAGIQKELIGISNLSEAWKGHLAEHVVGQSLLAADNIFSHKRHFWVGGQHSEAEVDFVMQHDNKIIPVEVKSGHNAKLKSLHLFMDKLPGGVAVRFWGQPFSVDEVESVYSRKKFRLVNLPYYYAEKLPMILDKVV